MLCCHCCGSLLHGAEELCLRKRVLARYGGGRREFIFSERACYEGVEQASSFLSSEERARVISHLLFSVRGMANEEVAGVKLYEGMPVGESQISFYLFTDAHVQV